VTAATILAPLVALLSLAGAAAAQDSLAVGDLGILHGDPRAPVQVVEFSDFSCPYCATFHQEARDSLFATFVAEGQVRWISLPYVSGLYPHSRSAAAAAWCAGVEGRYEALSDLLYRHRDRWVGGGRADAVEAIRALGREAGLDREALRRCMDAPDTRDRIRRVRRLAREVGVRGTPTYFIDGFPAMGALPFAYVRRLVDRRLEAAGGG
jgi:protein-disulfide isomerase